MIERKRKECLLVETSENLSKKRNQKKTELGKDVIALIKEFNSEIRLKGVKPRKKVLRHLRHNTKVFRITS